MHFPLVVLSAIFILLSSPSFAASFTVNGITLKKEIKPLREIKRANVVNQSLDFSCGTAGLSTLFNFYLGDNISEAEIIEALLKIIPLEKVKERRGFSLLDLKLYAQQRGYNAVGYKMDIDFLRELNKPVLVPIKFKNYRHFVIVRGVVADRVFIADPAAGNVSMKIDKFLRIWTEGIGLVIEKPHKDTEEHLTNVALTVKKDDFVISDYKQIRNLLNADLIRTTYFPTEW